MICVIFSELFVSSCPVNHSLSTLTRRDSEAKKRPRRDTVPALCRTRLLVMGVNSRKDEGGTDTRGAETHGEEETPVTSKLRVLCRSSQAMPTPTGEAVRLDLIKRTRKTRRGSNSVCHMNNLVFGTFLTCFKVI